MEMVLGEEVSEYWEAVKEKIDNEWVNEDWNGREGDVIDTFVQFVGSEVHQLPRPLAQLIFRYASSCFFNVRTSPLTFPFDHEKQLIQLLSNLTSSERQICELLIEPDVSVSLPPMVVAKLWHRPASMLTAKTQRSSDHYVNGVWSAQLCLIDSLDHKNEKEVQVYTNVMECLMASIHKLIPHLSDCQWKRIRPPYSFVSFKEPEFKNDDIVKTNLHIAGACKLPGLTIQPFIHLQSATKMIPGLSCIQPIGI